MLRGVWKAVKIAAVVALCVELASMVLVKAGTYMAYGQVIEIVKVAYDTYTVFTARQGVRPTAHNRPHERFDSMRRVWMFGGSTMLCSTTNQAGDTLASDLSGLLNGADREHGYVLTNYAVPSFNSLMEIKQLQKAMVESPERPDALVFYDGVNDANLFIQFHSADGHFGMDKLKGLMESSGNKVLSFLNPLVAAYYASYTRELAMKVRGLVVRLDPDGAELEALVDSVERRYDYVERQARDMGVPFLLFWQPARWIEDCGEPSEELRKLEPDKFDLAVLSRLRRNYRLITDAVARRLSGKPYFVDLRQTLCGRTFRAYWDDGVHMFNEGNQAMAKAMLPHVQAALEKRQAVLDSTRLFDLVDPQPGREARPVNFGPLEAQGQGFFRKALGPAAAVEFDAPCAGRMQLSLGMHNAVPGQDVRIVLNGRTVDALNGLDNGLTERRYAVDVPQGANRLELSFRQPPGGNGERPPVPAGEVRLSFVSLSLHAVP